MHIKDAKQEKFMKNLKITVTLSVFFLSVFSAGHILYSLANLTIGSQPITLDSLIEIALVAILAITSNVLSKRLDKSLAPSEGEIQL